MRIEHTYIHTPVCEQELGRHVTFEPDKTISPERAYPGLVKADMRLAVWKYAVAASSFRNQAEQRLEL